MDKYEHFINVFIPEFIKYDKKEFPGYEFIKTVDAGSSVGHILFGNHHYFLCLRSNDTVSTDVCWQEPLGFKRKTLQECEELAEDSEERFNKENSEEPTRSQKKSPSESLHYKSKKELIGLYFFDERTGEKIDFTTFRGASAQLGYSSETVRRFVTEKRSMIGGYKIVFPVVN